MNESKPLHPSHEELIALTIDELPAARAAEIREHLLDCTDCLEKTRALLRLPDHAPSPEEEVSDAEEAVAWQRLSAAIGAAEGAAPAPPPLRVLPGGGESPRPHAAKKPARTYTWLLAAAALVVATGVGLLVRRPMEIPVARKHLLSTEFTVRGGGEDGSNQAPCPSPGGTFEWTMDFTKRPAEVEEVQVLIRRDGGAAVVQKTQRVDAEGRIVLELPWDLITDGKYLVELSAGENSSHDVKEEFPVSVACR